MTGQKILFLNLKAFSFTGGIEKFNRAFLKALTDLELDGNITAYSFSMYDGQSNTLYFQPNRYKGFRGKKWLFVLNTIIAAHKYHFIISSHINLSLPLWIVKKLYPSKQIILIAHGVEIWNELQGIKKKVLQKADKILAVSAFTKQRIVELYGIAQNKITIFPNTIDPFFTYPVIFNKPDYLLKRYQLKVTDPVVLTLTRLASTERKKGYDYVLQSLSRIKLKYTQVKYILVGKPDEKEKQRISNVIAANQVFDHVILAGFIKEEEVTDHYLLADVFVLPSQKEGFGIVFIEAMACGLPVIAGNKDGSVDALMHGELGQLVDPDNEAEILQALQNALSKATFQPNLNAKKALQQKVIKAFGFEAYKKRLLEVLK